ncbi:hypothetical protein R3I93_007367 [Phoxinus phoxinus]
MDPSG